jgi:hypothetical protein
MSTSDLISLAASLLSVSAGDVQFVTAPVETYPANANEVEFAQPAASAMFDAIARDASIPKGSATSTVSPSASATGPALEVTPSASPEGSATAGTQAVGAAKDPATLAPTSTAVTPYAGATGPSATGTAGATASGSPSPGSSPSDIQSLATNNNGITGAAACSSDAGAFTGPNSP